MNDFRIKIKINALLLLLKLTTFDVLKTITLNYIRLIYFYSCFCIRDNLIYKDSRIDLMLVGTLQVLYKAD